MGNILEVRDYTIAYGKGKQEKIIVDHIAFSVKEGAITCLMGESGSGKSMTVLSVLGLLPENIRLKPESRMDFFGGSVFCIFQDPMNSFNFSIKMKKQMYQMVKNYRTASLSQFEEEIKDIMLRLNFEDPESVLEKYPFELSGGMLQRLMVACAVYAQPSLLIADEPTTALDMTVQSQLLKEFRRMNRETGISILLITHDFGVAAELADHMIVMNRGKVEEAGTVWDVFDHPQTEYTKRLIAASKKELDEYAESE